MRYALRKLRFSRDEKMIAKAFRNNYITVTSKVLVELEHDEKRIKSEDAIEIRGDGIRMVKVYSLVTS